MELVKIKTGTSLFYYIYILFCIGLFLLFYFLLRNRSKKVQYWTLFGFLAFNFVLHFVKLAFPFYAEKGFPEVIRKCTFENICAVSTLIFPFIFLSKGKAGKDYMFYLGSLSGAAGCLFPMPVIGLNFYDPEVIRYYICHAGIWIVPVLMVVFRLHELNYRRIWKTFVIYFAVLMVIIVNELILIRIGWVNTPETMEDFFVSDRDLGYALGLPESMQGAAKYVLWLTPSCWKDPYVPILWELFPVIILGGLYCVLLSLYWEHGRMKNDFLFVKGKAAELYRRFKARRAQGGDGDGADGDDADETKE